jgi:hypothetical protein
MIATGKRFLEEPIALAAAASTGAGAGVDGWPAQSRMSSPCEAARAVAALMTSMTWKGSTCPRTDGVRTGPA